MIVLKRIFPPREKLHPASVGQKALRFTVLIVLFLGAVWALYFDTAQKQPLYRGKPVQEWIVLLMGNDLAAATEASQALLEIGPESVNALIAALQVKDSRVKAVTVNLAVAVRLMNEPNYAAADVRGTAVYLLGQLGPEAIAAAPALVDCLGDSDPEVRRKASKALVKLGPQAIPHLTSALIDKDGLIQANAMKTLGEFGPRAREALPILLSFSRHPNEAKRQRALEAIRKIDKAEKGGARGRN